MNHLKRLSRNYRDWSEELRTIANSDCSEQRSAVLFKIAGEYDLMAKAADAIESSYKQVQSLSKEPFG